MHDYKHPAAGQARGTSHAHPAPCTESTALKAAPRIPFRRQAVDRPTSRVLLTLLAAGLFGWLNPLNAVVANGQPLPFSSSASSSTVRAWETFTVDVSVDSTADYYFAAMEARYPADQFEILSVQAIGLFSGGLVFYEDYEAGRTAISVTLTSALGSDQSGGVVRVEYRVLGGAQVGAGQLEFTDVSAGNSLGNVISVAAPAPLTVTVKTAPNDFRIVNFASADTVKVTEGDSSRMRATIQVIGVTGDITKFDELTVQLGVVDASEPGALDPGTWSESVWQDMSLISMADSTAWVYEREAAWRRDPGTYSIAARVTLLSGDVYYGGKGGLIDAAFPANKAGILAIAQITPGRYSVVEWDFNDESLLSSGGLPENLGLEFGLNNVEFVGFEPSAVTPGPYLSAKGWHVEEGKEKFWYAYVSLGGLRQIQVYSDQMSSLMGPMIFAFEVKDSLDVWTELATVYPSDLFALGALVDNLPVPDSLLVGDSLYVRWRRTLDVNQATLGTIPAYGKNLIDEVYITGVNPSASRLLVRPGDTDNNGAVQVEDVLPLGTHWQRRGPKAVYSFMTFEDRAVESWIPVGSTYADANGDGVVSHLDLQPVGLNFGDGTVGGQNAPISGEDAQAARASIDIPPLAMGESVDLVVENSGFKITGVAGVVQLQGLDATLVDWQWISGLRPELSRAGSPTPIEFFHTDPEGGMHFAEMLKRPLQNQEPEILASIRVTAKKDLPAGGRVSLMRLTTSDVKGVHTEISEQVNLTVRNVTSSQIDGLEQPGRTSLLPNYPNPFNPETVIPYRLSRAGEVRLELYNLLGQRLAVLDSGRKTAGLHELRFDAARAGLSSGTYVIRLVSDSGVESSSITLAK